MSLFPWYSVSYIKSIYFFHTTFALVMLNVQPQIPFRPFPQDVMWARCLFLWSGMGFEPSTYRPFNNLLSLQYQTHFEPKSSFFCGGLNHFIIAIIVSIRDHVRHGPRALRVYQYMKRVGIRSADF